MKTAHLVIDEALLERFTGFRTALEASFKVELYIEYILSDDFHSLVYLWRANSRRSGSLLRLGTLSFFAALTPYLRLERLADYKALLTY